MRIIAGKARGTKINTQEGLETRPTLDRVREALFSSIQNEVIDSIFLDLFSGSGAVGLEAASRGAEKVILCDKSHKAAEIIKKNIEKTHIGDKINLYESDYEKCIKSLDEAPDIIYLDPPYKTEYALNAIKLLLEKNLVKAETLIIVETDNIEIIDSLQNLEKLQIEKTRKYGRANLIFLRKIA